MDTGAVQVTVPLGPVAVPEKVVSLEIAGVDVAPPATGLTDPIEWSRTKEVALVVVQVSVEVPPEETWVGLAESVQVGPGGTVVVTVIGATQVTVPPGPVAVPV